MLEDSKQSKRSFAPMFTSDQYPGHFLAADARARFWQKTYFFLLGGYLVLTLLGALLAEAASAYSNQVGILFFSLSLLLLGLIYFGESDGKWYYCRAAAESIKTRTWRWMMNAAPYHEIQDRIQSERSFILDIEEILNSKREKDLISKSPHIRKPLITDGMREVNHLPWNEKLSIYKEKRIEDQLDYYDDSSQHHQKWTMIWFGILAAMTFIAIISSASKEEVRIVDPINLITFSGCVFTWLQSKKHRELSISYLFTKNEICIVKNKLNTITSEKEFSQFVIDTENAFSREHTQWAARKME